MGKKNSEGSKSVFRNIIGEPGMALYCMWERLIRNVLMCMVQVAVAQKLKLDKKSVNVVTKKLIAHQNGTSVWLLAGGDSLLFQRRVVAGFLPTWHQLLFYGETTSDSNLKPKNILEPITNFVFKFKAKRKLTEKVDRNKVESTIPAVV